MTLLSGQHPGSVFSGHISELFFLQSTSLVRLTGTLGWEDASCLCNGRLISVSCFSVLVFDLVFPVNLIALIAFFVHALGQLFAFT